MYYPKTTGSLYQSFHFVAAKKFDRGSMAAGRMAAGRMAAGRKVLFSENILGVAATLQRPK